METHVGTSNKRIYTLFPGSTIGRFRLDRIRETLPTPIRIYLAMHQNVTMSVGKGISKGNRIAYMKLVRYYSRMVSLNLKGFMNSFKSFTHHSNNLFPSTKLLSSSFLYLQRLHSKGYLDRKSTRLNSSH